LSEKGALAKKDWKTLFYVNSGTLVSTKSNAVILTK